MRNWRVDVIGLALALAAPALSPAASITPSGPEVAENLLRIELHLDRPLSLPLDMSRVALLDAGGAPIADAFLDLPLADRSGKTVTLLLHPGRIKTGVGPNVARGPALRSGHAVTLRIDDPQLDRPVTRHWQVVVAQRQAIDPQQWRITPPRAGGRQPLRMVLPSALDAASAEAIAVQGPDGRRLAGAGTLAAGEREWRFTPAHSWRPGAYRLRVHPRLEDPQGNRLCSAFEQAGQSRQPCSNEAGLAFDIAPR